jgi:hypothetical protein
VGAVVLSVVFSRILSLTPDTDASYIGLILSGSTTAPIAPVRIELRHITLANLCSLTVCEGSHCHAKISFFPFKIPVGKTRPTFAIKADNAAAAVDTAQTTGEVTLDAEKLIAYVQYSYELDEDAIIAVLPMITNQLASAAAEAVEDAVINGQEGGAIDNGVTAADTLCNGLRYAAEQVAGLQINVGGAVTAAKILEARKAMGKWGMNYP